MCLDHPWVWASEETWLLYPDFHLTFFLDQTGFQRICFRFCGIWSTPVELTRVAFLAQVPSQWMTLLVRAFLKREIFISCKVDHQLGLGQIAQKLFAESKTEVDGQKVTSKAESLKNVCCFQHRLSDIENKNNFDTGVFLIPQFSLLVLQTITRQTAVQPQLSCSVVVFSFGFPDRKNSECKEVITLAAGAEDKSKEAANSKPCGKRSCVSLSSPEIWERDIAWKNVFCRMSFFHVYDCCQLSPSDSLPEPSGLSVVWPRVRVPPYQKWQRKHWLKLWPYGVDFFVLEGGLTCRSTPWCKVLPSWVKRLPLIPSGWDQVTPNRPWSVLEAVWAHTRGAGRVLRPTGSLGANLRRRQGSVSLVWKRQMKYSPISLAFPVRTPLFMKCPSLAFL